jgi:hypothetical protein
VSGRKDGSMRFRFKNGMEVEANTCISRLAFRSAYLVRNISAIPANDAFRPLILYKLRKFQLVSL